MKAMPGYAIEAKTSEPSLHVDVRLTGSGKVCCKCMMPAAILVTYQAERHLGRKSPGHWIWLGHSISRKAGVSNFESRKIAVIFLAEMGKPTMIRGR